jgi:hypothetical protein
MAEYEAVRQDIEWRYAEVVRTSGTAAAIDVTSTVDR